MTVFLLLWQYLGRETNPILFTYPSAIAVAFVKLVASGELIKQMAVSLSALAVGFFVSLILGVALGLLLGMSRTAEAFFEPLINALTPLLMMWLGLGFSVKVSVVFLFAFFPILINTASGAKNVSAAMIEVARAYLAPRRKILFKVICPAALPFIMAGVRIAVGRALVGMIVAELFTAITGLGAMLSLYGNIFETAKMFVVIVVLACLGVILIRSSQWLERRLANWKESERAVG